jgi:hypothetical protein
MKAVRSENEYPLALQKLFESGQRGGTITSGFEAVVWPFKLNLQSFRWTELQSLKKETGRE